MLANLMTLPRKTSETHDASYVHDTVKTKLIN